MSLWYDILLLFFLLGGIALGFGWGMFRQLVALLALVFAFLFASYYNPRISQFVRDRFGDTDNLGRESVIFFVVFLAIWLFVTIGTTISLREPPRLISNLIDRLVGMVIGLGFAIVAAILVSVLLDYGTTVPWPRSDEVRLFLNDGIRSSILARFLYSLVPTMVGYLEPLMPYGPPPFLRTLFRL